MKTLVRITAILLVALLGFGYWLLASEPGTRWLWQRVAPIVGSVVQIETLEGTLIGPLTARGVVVRAADITVGIDSVRIDWEPVALLVRTAAFSLVQVQGVTIRRTGQASADAPSDSGGDPGMGLALPLGISIEALELDDLVWVEPERRLQVERLEARGKVDTDGRWHLTRLQAQAPWGRLNLAGNGGLSPGAPLAINARGRYAGAATAEPVAGSLQVSGELGRVDWAAELRAPFAGRAAGQVAWRDGLEWQGQGRFEDARLSRLIEGPALHLQRLQWQAAGDAASARATLALEPAGGGGLQADAGWQRQGGEGFRDDALHLNAEWHGLRWPPDGGWESAEGTLQAEGTPAGYRYRLDAALAGPDVPRGRWRARGEGSMEAVTLAALSGDWLGGAWDGEGRVDWGGGLHWDARLQAERVDPGRWRAGWDGAVGLELASEGQWSEQTHRASLVLERLAGSLRGQPVDGGGRLALAGRTWSVDAFTLRSGASRLEVHGAVAERWQLQWSLQSPSLDHLLPGATGALNADGRVAGPRAAPRLSVVAGGEGLALGAWGIEHLRVDGELAPMDDGRVDMLVKLESLRGPGIDWASTRLTIAGRAAAHVIELEAQGPTTGVDFHARGALATGPWQWRGTLQDSGFVLDALGQWRQREAVELAVGAAELELEDLCWEAAPARLCVGVKRRDGTSVAEGRLEGLALQRLDPWLAAQGMRLRGTLGGDWRLQWAGDGVDAVQLALAVPGGKLRYITEGTEPVETAIERLALQIQTRERDLVATAELDTGRDGALEARMVLPSALPWSGVNTEQVIDGRVQAELSRIGWLAPLLRQTAVPQGRLSGRLDIAGTLGSPRFDGRLALVEGAFIVPRAGVRISEVSLALASTDTGGLKLSGQARSGEGTLGIEGRLQLPAEQPWRLELAVRGERFQVAQLPQVKVVASPDLELAVQPQQVVLSGTLTVPSAELSLGEFGSAPNESADVVVVDRESRQPAGRWRLRSELRVVFGEAVHIHGYGFDGRIEGELAISDLPDDVPTARGTVTIVDGRYEAYGQKLSIETGRLLYADAPLDNPGLDLRAVRTRGEVRVGLDVTGRARSPYVTLISEPPMDDSEILSYLVVGRPLSDVSGGEADMMSQAALSLGLAGGALVAEDVGQRAGFDEVYIRSGETTEEAALVLGSYLSPRLYMQYTVGLWQDLSEFLLRYELTDNWSLETQSGETAGVDLRYVIER